MSFRFISPGKDIPHDLHVVIEISANSDPVKYEVDKEFDTLFVDRFMCTPMFYPVNYGYVPQTLADDGDPLDALVVTPYPVAPGSVVRCRPVGMLNMADENGQDEKILVVPHDKLTPQYRDVREYEDLPQQLLQQIEHFFENYKDLEQGKWVKIDRWQNSEAAREVIKRYVVAGQP